MTFKGELELCTRVQLAIEAVKEPSIIDRDLAVAEFENLYGKNFDKRRVILQPERFISGPGNDLVKWVGTVISTENQ